MNTESEPAWLQFAKGTYGSILFLLAEADKVPSNSLLEDSFTYFIYYNNHRQPGLEQSGLFHNKMGRDVMELEKLDGIYNDDPMIETGGNYVSYTTNDQRIMKMIDDLKIAIAIARDLEDYDWGRNGPEPIELSHLESLFQPGFITNPNQIPVSLAAADIRISFTYDETITADDEAIYPDHAVINDSDSIANLRKLVKFCLEHLPRHAGLHHH